MKTRNFFDFRRNRFIDLSRLVCFFVVLGIAFFNQGLFAQTAATLPTAVIQDVDGDGLKDCSIETDLSRMIISSKTGNPSVLYLKGQNFEENMYPPVLQDIGYQFASETMKAFSGEVVGDVASKFGYQISVDDKDAEKIVIVATANIAGEKFETGGISLAKKYTIFNKSYEFSVEYIVSNLAEKLVAVGNEKDGGLKFSYGPGIFMDPFGQATILGLKQGGVVEKFSDAESLNKAGLIPSFSGIGLKNDYFCVLMEVPSLVKISALDFDVNPLDAKKKKHKGHLINIHIPTFNLGARESRTFGIKIYSGPMLLDQLKAINREQVSDYGFLSTILLRILQFFYGLIPNYGLAIILLTLVVRLALYPLTLKQTNSMAQMQKIQPKVQDLKDRHKDNPQKFNEEVLKLYQKHNVNPLGGCLPLLLQLPILIALYNTIRIAVELRKIPFLWVPDLSKGDPLLILPIAIAALMYYQQNKMTDPQQQQQQQMMAMMPMFMFMITWSLPSGLLLYWFASSVIGLIQQLQASRHAAAIKEE